MLATRERYRNTIDALDAYLGATANENVLIFLRNLPIRDSQPLINTADLLAIDIPGCYHNPNNPNYKGLHVPQDGRINYILGDIHGDYENLRPILDRFFKNPNVRLIGLGDYIDRGKYSLKTIKALLLLQSICPERIVLLMGNHEYQLCFYLQAMSKFHKDFGKQTEVGWGLAHELAEINTPESEFFAIGEEISKRLLVVAYGKDWVATHSSLYGGDPLANPDAVTYVDEQRAIPGNSYGEIPVPKVTKLETAEIAFYYGKTTVVRGHSLPDLAKQQVDCEEGVVKYRDGAVTIHTIHTTGGASKDASSGFQQFNPNPKILMLEDNQEPIQVPISVLSSSIGFQSSVNDDIATRINLLVPDGNEEGAGDTEERTFVNQFFSDGEVEIEPGVEAGVEPEVQQQASNFVRGLSFFASKNSVDEFDGDENLGLVLSLAADGDGEKSPSYDLGYDEEPEQETEEQPTEEEVSRLSWF